MKVFDDTACQLGEGPLWHPTRSELFWFDILNHRLHTQSQQWQFDTYVSAAGWIDEDSLLIASATALSRFDLRTGASTELTPLEADNPVTRSNDGRTDPLGGFWIGTMGINAEPGAGAIWRFYKGELRCLYPDITISNAICFSPDGESACFTDTNTQKIMRVALDANGWPSGDPWVHVDLTGTAFRPDGAVFDSAGNLFSAQWGTSRVAAYDPNGVFIEAFEVPAVQASCPAFGGPDYTTLHCTTAAVGLDGPTDGRTYATETLYTGQREHQVIL